MSNSNLLGSYYPEKSIIHSINPLIKIISILILLLSIFINNNIYLSLIVLLVIILISLFAKLPYNTYLKVLYGLKYIILFTIIIYLLFNYNLIDIVVIVLRLYSIVLYTTIITMTTSHKEMTRGIEMFLYPFSLIGLNVNKVSLMLTLALRFIPTILTQADKIMKSQRSRGIDYNSYEINKKLYSLKTILLPIFILTLRRADTISDVLQLRMYDLNSTRSHLINYEIKMKDIIFLIISILILALSILEVFI